MDTKVPEPLAVGVAFWHPGCTCLSFRCIWLPAASGAGTERRGPQLCRGQWGLEARGCWDPQQGHRDGGGRAEEASGEERCGLGVKGEEGSAGEGAGMCQARGRNVPGPEQGGGGEGDRRVMREERPRFCKVCLDSLTIVTGHPTN